MSKPRPTVVIDTNAINVRGKNLALNVIEALAERGLVEIVKTDVLDTELQAGYGQTLNTVSNPTATPRICQVGSGVIVVAGNTPRERMLSNSAGLLRKASLTLRMCQRPGRP